MDQKAPLPRINIKCALKCLKMSHWTDSGANENTKLTHYKHCSRNIFHSPFKDWTVEKNSATNKIKNTHTKLKLVIVFTIIKKSQLLNK